MRVADAAYKYAIKSGVLPSRILLYGQSIGSGLALGVAKREPVAGVMLHSPFLSGIQVLDSSPECCCKPSCVFACCDFYHNDHAVRSVRCPVFIMHGQDDDFIPLWHGVRLRACLPENCAWPAYFPEEACHNDLVEVDPETYYAKLRAFVKSIKEGQAVTLGRETEGEMATSEGELPVQRPAQVAMVSLPSGGDPWCRRHKKTGSVAGRGKHIPTPSSQVAMASAQSDGIERFRCHTQRRRPTQPGAAASGQNIYIGTRADRHCKSADSHEVAVTRRVVGETETSKGKFHVLQPVGVATAPARRGGVARYHGNTRTPRPMQPGSVTGRSSSPGAACGQSVSLGTSTDHGSQSLDPLGSILAAMSQATTPCSVEDSPPPRLSLAPQTSPAPPRPSRTTKASPGAAGVSKLALSNTEEMSLMMSHRTKVNSDYRGTCGVVLPNGTQLPKPSLPSQGFWEPVLGGAVLTSPKVSPRPSASPRIVGFMSF